MPASSAEIHRLASDGESHFLEFKRKVDNPEKIVKELVAFSNADGGKLLIGISDDGKVPGLDHPEGDLFILEKAIRKYTKSQLKLTSEIIPVSSSRSVILIEIPESNKKPNYFQEGKNMPKEVFVRVKDECVRASREWAQLMSFQHRRVFIEYGQEEEWLLSHLADAGEITLNDFSAIRKIPRRQASQILVRLSAAGVMKLIPGYGEEDKFQLT